VLRLAYSPEYARRLADRISDEMDTVIKAMERRECYETLRTVYYDLLTVVYGILLDYLVIGRDIGMRIRDYEKALEERIEKLREEHPELRSEIRRLEKMKITEELGKRPEDITLGDLIGLFKSLGGKLLTRCFYEHLRRGEEEKRKGGSEAGGEEEEG
jgi:hypothetical protein